MEEPELKQLEMSRLLNRMIDGSIEAGEMARVKQWLRRDPAARREYYDLLAVDMLLAERYEMPDHIAVHAKAMNDSWSVRRERRGIFAWSAMAAAAALLLSLAGFFFFRTRQPDVLVKAAADSAYQIEGGGAVSGGRDGTSSPVLKAGQVIDVKHGVVSLALGAYVEATLEGPARLRLGDREGKVELTSGSAFFEISPGGKGFEVRTPAGVIRDIGTKFGVKVMPDGRVESHVATGAIEVQTQDGGDFYRINAGSAGVWKAGEIPRVSSVDLDRFIRTLPNETTIFRDDFSEATGTLMSGKLPDLGDKWVREVEINPTTVSDGWFDTSNGPRTVSTNFKWAPQPGMSYVCLTTFRTRKPENTKDKHYRHDADESISLRDRSGNLIFSLVARASRDHRWQLKDERTGKLSIGTRVTAFDEHVLTVSYDPQTGYLRLFEGSSAQGVFLDDLAIEPGIAPSTLVISNANGGDLAIDDLSVKMVAYPKKSGAEGSNPSH